MICCYSDACVPAPGDVHISDEPLFKSTEGLLGEVDAAMENFEVDQAARRIWDVLREANRYVVEQEPWNWAREPGQDARRRRPTVLYNLAEAIRIVATFSSPFILSKAAEIASGFSIGRGWDRLSERTSKWD